MNKQDSFISLITESYNKSYSDIFFYARKASRRYKTYAIPKKTGGQRLISQPSRELKGYQRFIVKNVFSKLPIHSSVYSYQENKNIKQMALLHKDTKYLLRIDFKDFFPSLKAEYIRKFLKSKQSILDIDLSTQDITLINMLICKGNKLTIGAPSSPVISNVLLYDFDIFFDTFSKNKNIIYSRYADDLYFSTSKPNILKDVLGEIEKYLKEYYIKLSINYEKNIFTSKKRRRTITGLNITSDGKISVGRNKKRYIKSLIFKYMQTNILPEELNYLKGYLSYLYSIEPEYINNLRRKYSNKVIAYLLPLKET